jgi:ATP-dependent Clp protease ATP-binding subunit ClpC
MFERFTERARQVIVLAQDEAKAMKHSYIGTEHILLGLLREEHGLAARVLDEAGIDIANVRLKVERIVGRGAGDVVGRIPFSARAKKVFDLALREALSLGHNYIGTEHVLLGLIRNSEGMATTILDQAGVDAEEIRAELIALLNKSRTTASPPPAPPKDAFTRFVEALERIAQAMEDRNARKGKRDQ